MITLTSLLGAIGYLLYAGSTYEAEVKLLVLLGPEKFSAMEASSKENYGVAFRERGENIANEMEIILDHKIAANVFKQFKEALSDSKRKPMTFLQRLKTTVRKTLKDIKKFVYEPLYMMGLATRLSEDELMFMNLRNSLHVEFLEVTDIIRATFRDSDPNVATFALNAYIEQYLKLRARILKGGETKGFYEEQTTIYEKKLRESEAALEAFRNTEGISLLNVQKDLLLKQIAKLEARQNDRLRELEENRLRRDSAQKVYTDKKHWLETPEFENSKFDFASLDSHYFDLLAKRNQLLNTLNKSSRRVKSIDFQINRLRAEKAGNIIRIFDVQFSILQADTASFAAELTGYRKDLVKLNDSESRLAALQRTLKLIETSYITYQRKVEDLRISEKLNRRKITSVRIISPAATSPIPVGPKKLLIVGLAIFLGGFLGIGYAMIANFFDHTFRSAQDIERILNVPLLATMPYVGK